MTDPAHPDAGFDNPGGADAPGAGPARPPRARPVRPRPAASLLLWRDGPAGTEVLMGQRHAGLRFMPNRLVFPGGRVDPADRRAPAAAEPRPEVLAMLSRAAPGPLARALMVAAARELREETALALGPDPARPALDALDYLCRAVTPPDRPIRFDARFLVAPAAAATGALQGSGELEGLRWLAVEAALALDLAAITRCVLGEFRGWLAMATAERAARPLVCYRGFERRGFER